MKHLDDIKPDPKNPGKNQKAIDYVVSLELQKTIAVWDEYIAYFDVIDDLTGKKREPL